MLSPEVWCFKPPQHFVSLETRPCKKTEVPKIVSTHYFNHSVSLVLPDTVSIPDGLRACITEDTDYYKVKNLKVVDLLNQEFIEGFIKKGELSLLTIGAKIDIDNVIAITPTGQLLLSLLVEDFQQLGLEGSPSFFDRKVHTRYVVKIDLTSESFVPGKKNYEYTRKAIGDRLNQTFDVIITWNPPDESVCPSSVAAWFHERGYDVNLCQQKLSQKAEYSLKVPILAKDTNIEEFIEWLGVLSIGGDLKNEKKDDYANTFVCPEPFINVGQVQYLQSTGFLGTNQITQLYKALDNYVQLQQDLPWAAIHVQGFADSPVSWDLKEHTFFTDGDNSYTVLFRPNADTVIRTGLSSNNKPRIKQ